MSEDRGVPGLSPGARREKQSRTRSSSPRGRRGRVSTSEHSAWPGLRDGSGRAVGSSQDQAFAGILGEEKFCWSYQEDGLSAIMPSRGRA